MTPAEMVLTLRICGNHPKYDSFTCKDCPWILNCDHDGGGAELSLRAADIIENLLKEVERLKKYEQAIDQILKPDADEMMGREAGKK